MSCIGSMDFISKDFLKKMKIPDEIRDTTIFKPHKESKLIFKILEYPFLKIGGDISNLREAFANEKFIRTNKDNVVVFKKSTDFNLIMIYVVNEQIARISISLNIDI